MVGVDVKNYAVTILFRLSECASYLVSGLVKLVMRKRTAYGSAPLYYKRVSLHGCTSLLETCSMVVHHSASGTRGRELTIVDVGRDDMVLAVIARRRSA